jgi:drug/metabolite transporter (DMT)-like permease
MTRSVTEIRLFNTSLLVAAAASWGLGTVLSKYALGGYPPAILLPLQLLCSAVLLGAFVLVTAAPLRSVRRKVRLALLGVLNPGFAYALGLIGLSHIEASTSVVIWATEPVIIMVMAFAFLREQLTRWAVGCLATAMIGIALIVGAPTSGNEVIGVAITFASVTSCALYTIILRKMSLTDGTLPVVWIQQVSALVFALVISLIWYGLNGVSIEPSGRQTLAALASGATYYGLGFLLYVSGLRRTSAARAGTFLTLIPVFGLVFSALLLQERFTRIQMIGALIVIATMAVLTWSDSRSSIRSDTPTTR